MEDSELMQLFQPLYSDLQPEDALQP